MTASGRGFFSPRRRGRLLPVRRSLSCLHVIALLAAVGLPALGIMPASATAADVVYIYDEVGRLIAVVDPATETATYSYDAVGNLLSISRQSSASLRILDFTPKSGLVGTTVRIFGTAFSATTTQNTVKFNGVSAVVSSATTTELVTKVPTGATTGFITITTPAGSTTSSVRFTVTSSRAPTITGVTPQIGLAGTGVTITGNNFDPTPAHNKVVLNVMRPLVSAATATALTMGVPSSATSGRISVSTSWGKAQSSADFFVPPPSYTPADVASTGRMTMGQSKTVTIGTANKIALIVFDGTATQRISLQLTTVTMYCPTATLYKPDGGTLTQQGICSSGFIDVRPLPVTGTYTLLVDPSDASVGSATLTLYSVPADVTGTITVGGPAVTVTTTVPGQNAKLIFSGTVGMQVTIRVTSNAMSCVGISLLKPDNSTLTSSSSCSSSFTLIPQPLPTTGTYVISIDPSDANIGSMQLQVTTP